MIKKKLSYLNGSVLIDNLLLAESSIERMRGLLGRPQFDNDSALIIPQCNSVHTLFMKYTIDVVYLNKKGVILKIVRSLKPWRFSGCLKAFYTLEMLAENSLHKELSIGQTLSWLD